MKFRREAVTFVEVELKEEGVVLSVEDVSFMSLVVSSS